MVERLGVSSRYDEIHDRDERQTGKDQLVHKLCEPVVTFIQKLKLIQSQLVQEAPIFPICKLGPTFSW